MANKVAFARADSFCCLVAIVFFDLDIFIIIA